MPHKFKYLVALLFALPGAACESSETPPVARETTAAAETPSRTADAPVPPEVSESFPVALQTENTAGEMPQPTVSGDQGGEDSSGASAQSEATRPVPNSGRASGQRGAPGGGSPSGEDGSEPAAILENAERVYTQLQSMEADFEQEVYVPLLERTIRSRGKIFHRAPDRFLMRFDDPAGDVIVADGEYIWMYYPSNDSVQVMRTVLAEGGQQADLQREFLSNATERFNATRTGAERVTGRQTHALRLVPRTASPYEQVRLWIDTQDFLVRRFEITEQNGSVRTLEIRNIRPNVALKNDLFRFTPPPGSQVIEP